MTKHLLTSALFAGLVAGLFAAFLQLTLIVPLVLQAEQFETAPHYHGATDAEPTDAAGATIAFATAPDGPGPADGADTHDDHGAASPSHDTETPQDAAPSAWSDLPRLTGTIGSTFVTYTGFALVMVAGMALATRRGVRVDARRGALWGLAGFAAVHLAPAFGLPPELPGMDVAALAGRQVWWVASVVATSVALGFLVFGRGTGAVAIGVALLALPVLIGAPQPDTAGSLVPPGLAALYVARALGVAAVTWVVLGTVAGGLWARAQN